MNYQPLLLKTKCLKSNKDKSMQWIQLWLHSDEELEHVLLSSSEK